DNGGEDKEQQQQDKNDESEKYILSHVADLKSEVFEEFLKHLCHYAEEFREIIKTDLRRRIVEQEDGKMANEKPRGHVKVLDRQRTLALLETFYDRSSHTTRSLLRNPRQCKCHSEITPLLSSLGPLTEFEEIELSEFWGDMDIKKHIYEDFDELLLKMNMLVAEKLASELQENEDLPQQQRRTSAVQKPSPEPATEPETQLTSEQGASKEQRPHKGALRGQGQGKGLRKLSSRAKITQRVNCRARVPQKLSSRTRATDRSRPKHRLFVRTRTTQRVSHSGRKITERVNFRTCATQSINGRTTQKVICRYRVS
ncbi:hypothetical protein A6R68_06843, partial [Neotoma lepida]